MKSLGFFLLVLYLFFICNAKIESTIPYPEKEVIEYTSNNDVFLVRYYKEDKKGFLISNECGKIYLLVESNIFNKQLRNHEESYKWLYYTEREGSMLRLIRPIYVLTLYDYETDYITFLFNFDNVGDSSMIKNYKLIFKLRELT